jgi:2-polyprenyl-6-methoxyphenol hydroxylase-like FAD-dependent oxidoreductase
LVRCDVAIAGGGPAALTAAILLARAGARVVVAAPPAARPPRPGETLPGAGLRLLRSLDLPLPREADGHRKLTGIASAWDGPLVETDHLRSPDGAAWLIDRPAFDSALATEAAAAGAASPARRPPTSSSMRAGARRPSPGASGAGFESIMTSSPCGRWPGEKRRRASIGR